MAALSLIVLRCAALESSKAFFTALGLNFEKEQHGEGPIHYSCELGEQVLELYPGKPGAAPIRTQSGASMYGFRVESLDRVLKELQNLGAEIIHSPSDTPWGRRAVVLDPDGRSIELIQAEP